MWRRNLGFAGFCLAATALVVSYVQPRRKFAGAKALVSFEQPIEVGDNGQVAGHRYDLLGIRDVVNQLDREFEAQWQTKELEPTTRVDPLRLTRRISLALTGTIPSLEEIQQIEQLPPDQVGQRWLDYLFQDRRYGDHVAERMARALVGVEDGPFLVFRRRRFVSWLSDRFMDNAPYDQLVREIVTSSGLWTDSPGVNFLTVTTNPEIEERPDPVRLAGRTTRAFLGVRLDCMQCHDDNLDGEWLQSNFHELAAFYNSPTPTIVGIVDKERPYEFQYLYEEETETVEPQVPFYEELLPTEGPPRERLATWITHPENRAFARAAVNRGWAILFGRPLIEPVDEIPLAGPFPPGLEVLAEDFATHGFDLQRLWRILVASHVFQLDSRADHELTRAHEKDWARFPKTRLRPEQIAGALLQSARLNTVDRGSHILLRMARFGETQDFVRDYGDRGEDEFAPQAGTIPQRLVMMNGALVHERTRRDLIINAATRIARLTPDDGSALQAAYLAVLTRKPTAAESDYFLQQWRERAETESPERVEDLCWVLVNSSEFSWNH
jgi:hypothetical protein